MTEHTLTESGPEREIRAKVREFIGRFVRGGELATATTSSPRAS